MDYYTIAGPRRRPILGSRAFTCFNGPGLCSPVTTTIHDFPQDVTDPFVDVKLGNARIAKTSIIDNDLNPRWNETFRIEVICAH
jgi:hypothetical protein